MDKTSGIREHAKKKSENRQAEVLATIQKMKKNGDKISFYSVAKMTGASKNYLYHNEAIANEIKECRDNPVAPRTQSSDKAIITSQKLEIKKLKARIAELEKANSESYKEKYEKLLVENKDLKKQLASAYTAW